MSVRLQGRSHERAVTAAVPLRERPEPVASRRPVTVAEEPPDVIELALLYHIILRTFLTHTYFSSPRTCAQCYAPWPCDEVRLAFRLREMF